VLSLLRVAVPSQLCSLLGVRGGVICAHDCSRISTRAQTNKPANASPIIAVVAYLKLTVTSLPAGATHWAGNSHSQRLVWTP
jgi:hypothetical protein